MINEIDCKSESELLKYLSSDEPYILKFGLKKLL